MPLVIEVPSRPNVNILVARSDNGRKPMHPEAGQALKAAGSESLYPKRKYEGQVLPAFE